MTVTAPVPVVYGHDPSGRPVAADIGGAGSPHILIAGGTGRGLTTLAGVIAAGAARSGSAVRACFPRQEDGTWPRNVPGITTAHGIEETARLITEASDDMYRRLAAIGDGTDPAAHQHALLAVDDYSYLAALDPRACTAVGAPLAEIAACGRAARMTLLMVAHVLNGFPSWMLPLFGTRIVLGPASGAAALRLLGDEAACRDVPDAPGHGTAVTGDGPSVAVRVLPPPGCPG